MIIDTSLKAKFYSGIRRTKKYIIVHYTANSGTTATAKSNANYFANGITRKASAHYCVDEKSIYQCVPDLCGAYAVGDNQKYTNGGASMKKVITNSNSISIEMVSHSDKNGNFYIPEATMQNTIELIKDLQKKYNIPDKNIYRHFDVTGKLCPKPLINSEDWNAFIGRLEEDLISKIKIEVNGTTKEVDGILKDEAYYIKLRDLSDVADIGYDAVRKIPIVKSK